jgi:hypothetical protein
VRSSTEGGEVVEAMGNDCARMWTRAMVLAAAKAGSVSAEPSNTAICAAVEKVVHFKVFLDAFYRTVPAEEEHGLHCSVAEYLATTSP